MKGLLRRLRGIIATGLTWAVGWAGLYGALLLVMRLLGAEAQWDLSLVLRVVFNVGSLGFIAGSMFGAILSLQERHKKLEDLTFGRIALWGGLAGLGIVALLGAAYIGPVIIFTVLGVGSATGTVALARRAKDADLLEGEDEPLPAIEGE
jgi:hypothetical protein